MGYEICFPDSSINDLAGRLLYDRTDEAVAFVQCARSGDRLLVADYRVLGDDELGIADQIRCRPDLGVERDVLGDMFADGWTPLVVHSHPFADAAWFSGCDVAAIDAYTEWLTGLYPDRDFGFGVVGYDGVEAVVYDSAQDRLVDAEAEVLGTWDFGRDDESERSDPDADVDEERYDRNIRALTAAGQEALGETTVAVVGCGGIGSLVVEELVRLGVRDIILVDPDKVEESNLPRLVGAMPEHVGRPKVDVLEQHLWLHSSDIDVTALQQPVEETGDALVDADVIMAGVDRVSARSWVNEFAVRHLKYYIDAGVEIATDDADEEVEAFHGFVQTIIPGDNACFDCLDRGDPGQAEREQLDDAEREDWVDQGYIEESDLAPEPAVIHLNGVVASMAVQEFAKLVTGFDHPTDFLRYEGLDHELVPMTAGRTDGCVTCDELLGHGFPSDVEDDPIDDEQGLPTTA